MDESISRFWDNYISKTNTCNVANHAQRWYVKHVEAYIKTHPERRLADTEPGDVIRYMEEIGRKPEFPFWRLRQVADALRILFTEIIKPDWAEGFNWHTWMPDSRELSIEHATLTRAPDAQVASAKDMPAKTKDGVVAAITNHFFSGVFIRQQMFLTFLYGHILWIPSRYRIEWHIEQIAAIRVHDWHSSYLLLDCAGFTA